MHTAFLLAAGLGTRLRPLTNHRPKALLPVCGVPMLDYALGLARRHGHTSVIVNAHHLWEQVAAWAEDRGVALQVELPEVLGTGGGLRAAIDDLADVVVVLNADILTNIDLRALADAVPRGGAAMTLREAPDEAEAFGPVERDERGNIVRIASIVGEPGIPGTHFTGVHAMHREAIARIPDGFQCVLRTAYAPLVPRHLVKAWVQPELVWFDVGTPGAYLQANLAVLRGEIPVTVDPWTRGKRHGDCFVGQGARIEGAASKSVIGDDVHVPRGTRLHRCVVWDGVEVPEGEHEDAVIHDGGVLQVGF